MPMPAAAAQDAGARRAVWTRLPQPAIAAALLALVLWKADVRQIGDALFGVELPILVAVVAINVPIAMLFAVRSHLVLRRLGFRVDAELLVASAILGNVASSLTPASSGELLRTAALRTHGGVGTEDGLALGLYERGVSAYLLFLATCLAAAFVALPLAWALGACIACAGLVLLLPAIAGILPNATETNCGAHGSRLRRSMHRVRLGATRLRWLLGDRQLLLAWSLLTELIFAAATLQYWLLARAVSASGGITPQEAALAFGASQLAGSVSLLPLGLGAADGSLTALLARAGLSVQQSTAVAVLVRLTTTLPLGALAVASHLYLAHRAPTPEAASAASDSLRPAA